MLQPHGGTLGAGKVPGPAGRPQKLPRPVAQCCRSEFKWRFLKLLGLGSPHPQPAAAQPVVLERRANVKRPGERGAMASYLLTVVYEAGASGILAIMLRNKRCL